MNTLTEEEAKTKWCPFARTSYSTVEEIEDGGVNRAQGPNEVSCCASACMAWRWYRNEIDAPDERGYCGLAGRP